MTNILKEAGVQNLTVQLEKQTYFQHMSGLGMNVDSVFDRTNGIKAQDYSTSAVNFIKPV